MKESDSIRIYQREGDSDGSGIHMFRSVTTKPIRCSMDSGFADQLVMDTTEKLRSTYPRFDPTFTDGQVLAVIHRDGLALTSIKWCAFKTPPVVWDRDFVYMDVVDPDFRCEAFTACTCLGLASAV